MTQRRIAPSGEIAEWRVVDIEEAQNETWSEYNLADGTTMETKTILAEVEKAFDQDGEPLLDEEDEPYYRVQFDSVVEADPDQS